MISYSMVPYLTTSYSRVILYNSRIVICFIKGFTNIIPCGTVLYRTRGVPVSFPDWTGGKSFSLFYPQFSLLSPLFTHNFPSFSLFLPTIFPPFPPFFSRTEPGEKESGTPRKSIILNIAKKPYNKKVTVSITL